MISRESFKRKFPHTYNLLKKSGLLRAILKKRKRFARIRTNGDGIRPFVENILKFDASDTVAIDRAHNVLLFGLVTSAKPNNLLELGVGSGYLSTSLLHAITYNQAGSLTCVDNWLDTGGEEPPFAAALRKAGVRVICSSEEEFVKSSKSDEFDFLMSDADHSRSHEWLDHHLRIVRPGGTLVFHDTNNDMFPNLKLIQGMLADRGVPFRHFRENTRPDERCDRGLIVAFK